MNVVKNLQDKLKSQPKITNMVKNSQDELKSRQMVKKSKWRVENHRRGNDSNNKPKSRGKNSNDVLNY